MILSWWPNLCAISECIKSARTYQGKPRLYLSSQRSLMARGSRSMAASVTQTQRRSDRANLGCNGRNVQLDRLGEQLVAPTCLKKRQFVPEDGLVLENNVLAPAPKKCRSKVFLLYPMLSFLRCSTLQNRRHALLNLNHSRPKLRSHANLP